MSANQFVPRTRIVAVSLLFLFGSCFLQAAATDLKLECTLIWGTNTEESPNPDHKAIDPALARKLLKVFKWKHYFEVSRQTLAIPVNQTKSAKMSSKCVVEAKNLGGSRVEVKLFGEGKLVEKRSQPLPPGEDLILAGDAKNDTAWFVVFRAINTP